MDFKAPSKYTGKSLNPIPNVIMNINKTYVEQEVQEGEGSCTLSSLKSGMDLVPTYIMHEILTLLGSGVCVISWYKYPDMCSQL